MPSRESSRDPGVSIVVPMYNEEENVGPLCEAIREALEEWDRTYEVILVDDGSSDGTLTRLREESAADSRVRVLVLARNAGQTLAMAAGFGATRGRIVVSMDGDLQNDPGDIPLIVGRIDAGYDVVCGWRKNRQDTWLSRTLPSRIANWMIARITGIPIHDNGCSLKAYRSDVVRALNLYSEMHRFLPALSSMTGARIDEVVVRHHPRVRGQSKYGIARTFRVLSDMITIKMITQFVNRPGRWFGILSLPWLVLALISAGTWLAGLFSEDRPSIVFSSLAVIFLYLFGFMINLAIIGEVYLATSSRRRYFCDLAKILAVQDAAPGRNEPSAGPARDSGP